MCLDHADPLFDVGVLVGHPVERLYRSVRALRIYEGATDIQRLIVAGGLLKS